MSQVLPEFTTKPKTYTLHNATPESIQIMWAGHTHTIPPVDAVCRKSAKYSDGTPIPGTYVLQDGYTFDKDGQIPTPGQPYNWIAADAIRNVLGIDPYSGEAVSPVAKKGVSFLPDGATKDQVETTREKGARRYQEFLVEWADATLAAYAEAADRAKRAGLEARAPGPDYQKALLVMDRYKETVRRRLNIQEEPALNEELELEAFIKAKALELAERTAASTNVDKVKLAEELIQDPNVRNQLKRKYSIRQRGFMDVPDKTEEPPG